MADQLLLPGLPPPSPRPAAAAVAPARARADALTPPAAPDREFRSITAACLHQERTQERFVLPFEATSEILAEERQLPTGELLGLTLWRPWQHCLLIAPPSEGKRVENRPWYPQRFFGPMRNGIAEGLRGERALWIAIHAGRTIDEDAVEELRFSTAKRHLGPLLNGEILTIGWPSLIVGVGRVARVLDVRALGHAHPEVRRHKPWICGPYAWEFADVAAFGHGWQVPCKGAQGLWALPSDVNQDVRLKWAAARLGILPPKSEGKP